MFSKVYIMVKAGGLSHFLSYRALRDSNVLLYQWNEFHCQKEVNKVLK